MQPDMPMSMPVKPASRPSSLSGLPSLLVASLCCVFTAGAHAQGAVGDAGATINVPAVAVENAPVAVELAKPLLVDPAMAALTAKLAQNTLNMELLVLVFAGALVFFMQLGFAFLESGMSRSKNTVNVLMKNFCDLCFGGVVFWAVGYGLMYGTNTSGWLGTTHFLPSDLAAKEAGVLFFQMMFAAAAATIVSGAIAERARFYTYIIGSILICGLIYPVVGSWVWGSNHGGQGWLKAMGFVDFAGSTVVHSVGGWCALAALLVVKPRLGRYAANGSARMIQGHNLSNTVLGGLVLWVGWFGFNAGSVVTLEGGSLQLMGVVALNTHLAGCAAALGAMLVLKLKRQRVLLSVTVNGAIGGLVAVTAGSAVLAPQWAILVGFVAGVLTSVAQPWLDKLKIDDVVGAVSVHLIGGIWGTLAVGLFASTSFMSLRQFNVQLVGVLAVGAFTFVCAYVVYRVLDAVLGLRVSPLEEQRGLDISEHAEVSYPEFQNVMLHTGAAAAQQLSAKPS